VKFARREVVSSVFAFEGRRTDGPEFIIFLSIYQRLFNNQGPFVSKAHYPLERMIFMLKMKSSRNRLRNWF